MAKEKLEKSSKVSFEIAEAEVNSWLDYKKVDDLQREDQEGQIKALISFVQGGFLELNEDKTFTHKLKFAVGESEATTQLTYKARLTEREISQKLHGVKSDDGDGRLLAHIQALTGQAKGIIAAMDKEDFKIARAIAVFFV